MHEGKLQLGQRGRDGFIALFDLAGGKQLLIDTARLRVGREQHQAGGVSIDAVQRHQMRVVETTDQTAQQRVLDIFARRGHRQKVRLVGDHQVFVDVQHLLLRGDRPLVRHFTEIVDAQTLLVGVGGTDGHALGIQHPVSGHPAQPLGAVDGLEMFAEAVQHGRPVARGQAQGTGLVSRGVELGCRHALIPRSFQTAIIAHGDTAVIARGRPAPLR